MLFDYKSPNDTVFTVRNVLVKFGEGVAAEVGYEAKRLGMTRALIITDSYISEKTEMPQMIKGYLEEAREAVVSLMMDVDFPSGLEEVGFSMDQVDELSQAAMKVERLLSCSPRRVTLEDVKKIYSQSMRNW